jgi:hypothetical protein
MVEGNARLLRKFARRKRPAVAECQQNIDPGWIGEQCSNRSNISISSHTKTSF